MMFRLSSLQNPDEKAEKERETHAAERKVNAARFALTIYQDCEEGAEGPQVMTSPHRHCAITTNTITAAPQRISYLIAPSLHHYCTITAPLLLLR